MGFLQGAYRRKFFPIALALIGAGGVVGATYFFSQGTDATPTADKTATNTVPPTVVPSTPDAQPEMPEIQPSSATSNVVMSAPAVAPAPTSIARVPAVAIVGPAVASSAQPTNLQLPSALALAETDPVAARLALTQLLDRNEIAPTDMVVTMFALRQLNAQLFYSPAIVANDPTMRVYTVKSGDSLSKIAKNNDVQADWRVIQRINGMRSERSLRVGQKLKLPVCAFHAEVSKSNYELRIYAGEGPTRVLIAAYTVGLGELNSTPTGAFMVRPKSKLINPQWKNPRTGESFAPDDPKNPIGERWIGLIGVEAHNQGIKGYGIHGTIEQASIGQQASMGCVRMSDGDVEMVYELLTEPNSTIVIAP